MHIAMLVVAGLVLLAIMHFGPGLIGSSFDGAKAFLWVWLAISILNGFYGHFRAGIQLSTATAVVMRSLILGQTPPVDVSTLGVDRN